MSEATSAFAAYSSLSNKKGTNKSKKNQNANGVKSSNKSTEKATIAKTTNKKQPTSPAVTKPSGAGAKGAPTANGATSKASIKNGATSKAATKAKPTVPKSTKANGNTAAPLTTTKQKENVAATKKFTSKAAANGKAKDAVDVNRVTKAGQSKSFKPLNDDTIDEWVEELMSGKTQLNKEQKERKKMLEKFFLSVQNSDTITASEIEEEEAESEFDEYTMNSYYEDSTGDEESWSDLSDEDDVDGSNNYSGDGDDDDEEAGPVTQKKATQKTATKRKFNDSKDDSATSCQAGAPKASKKKSRQTIGEIAPKASAGKVDNKGRRHTIGDMKPAASTSVNRTIKEEPMSPSTAITANSIEDGKKTFAWLISPIDVNDFFKSFWEQKACYIKRNNENIFKQFISFTAIDQMLVNNHIEFTTNIDVTSYKNGIRETLNPEGRALPPVVWENYSSGCSIRLLNPQTYMPNLCKLNSVLQEFFHCLVGANAYLTPPNSQGFAPHYDDIEAFVLQVEGRKRWRLYKPLEEHDVLPRESSRNFRPNEIGKPFFETVLMPGDVLYFPRGVIHQASTEPGYHSLHLTLSVYQKQSYADLLEKLMPIVLENAIKRNLSLRRGLPLNMFQHLGLVHSASDAEERSVLQEKVTTLVEKHLTLHSSHIDAAVDQLAKKYHREALPPELNCAEKVRTIRGSRAATDVRGNCRCDYVLKLTTNLRLLRGNILRLVREDGGIYRVYFHVDNAREYCKYDLNFIEIEASEAGTIEMLVRSYPAYVSVSQFPIEDDDRKLDVATALFERCLVMTEKPFR